MSIIDPNYGFELGYAVGTKSTVTQTISVPAGESVIFENVDTIRTAIELGAIDVGQKSQFGSS